MEHKIKLKTKTSEVTKSERRFAFGFLLNIKNKIRLNKNAKNNTISDEKNETVSNMSEFLIILIK